MLLIEAMCDRTVNGGPIRGVDTQKCLCTQDLNVKLIQITKTQREKEKVVLSEKTTKTTEKTHNHFLYTMNID